MQLDESEEGGRGGEVVCEVEAGEGFVGWAEDGVGSREGGGGRVFGAGFSFLLLREVGWGGRGWRLAFEDPRHVGASNEVRERVGLGSLQ